MWSADGSAGVPPPAGLKNHLVVLLEPGWRYDFDGGQFVSDDGQEIRYDEDLPEGSEIVHMIPELQRAEAESLSEDEIELARYLHIILPSSADPSGLLPLVAAWRCVSDVRLPPDISLPGVLSS